MNEEVLEEVLEELSVLSAIYCGSEELEQIQHCAETGFIYRIQTSVESDGKKTPLSLIFHLPPEYPQAPPDVSVSSAELSRKQCGALREGVLNEARSLPPGPMVHDLVLWLQQNFSDLAGTAEKPESPNPADSKAEELWTALLHLDHMRSRARYIKLIEKWTSELGLAGRLFLGKLILILLQGERRSIKEFIHLQRTVKVDVDSSGKRCKEKMMSVLCEIPLSEDFKKISAFEVREASSLEELKEEFDEAGSLKLYREFVPSLL